jgi:RNA polymerase sigma-70 factor (ECF subfamily)
VQDFDDIYRKNVDIVYRYLFSLSHDADLAEELTQQAFFEAIFTGSSKN